MRKLAVPLGAYLVVTIALPLVNGAGARKDFARHAAMVIAGCIAMIAIAWLANVANKRCGSRVGGSR